MVLRRKDGPSRDYPPPGDPFHNQWKKGPPMEELEKVPKELKRSATLSEEQHYELTSTLELLTLAAYVSKDGLVGHHWK